MAVRRDGSCWCPGSLASWAEDGRRVDDREKPQPRKGPVKVLHVHEDAMILAELFRNGSFQDSSQAPYDCLGPTHEGHLSGFLQAGSCVTDKATEPCARSHVYLWRHE